ncbi:MAG: FadR family transcriptional regulator [Planctomycetes bacterium]|nr:FadR family transcriptional regulator [Planctomycetota bacterium]
MNSIANSRESLMAVAVRQLTEHILSGKYHAGDFLPTEIEFSKMLQIGRSTIREAISILEFQGLLKRRHGKGLEFMDNSMQGASQMLEICLGREDSTYLELLEVRRLYEVHAASLAAKKARKSDLQNMKLALDKMLNENSTRDDYRQADYDFHLAVAKTSQNSILVFITKLFQSTLLSAIDTTIEDEKLKPEQTHSFHKAIYDAIASGDPKRAERAMLNHLKGTEKLLKSSNLTHF